MVAGFSIEKRFFVSKDQPFPVFQCGPGIIAVNDASSYQWDNYRKLCLLAVEELFDNYALQRGNGIAYIHCRKVADYNRAAFAADVFVSYSKTAKNWEFQKDGKPEPAYKHRPVQSRNPSHCGVEFVDCSQYVEKKFIRRIAHGNRKCWHDWFQYFRDHHPHARRRGPRVFVLSLTNEYVLEWFAVRAINVKFVGSEMPVILGAAF